MTALRALLLLLALSVSACGFALRKAPDFLFSTLYIITDADVGLGAKLHVALESSGKVQVLSDPAQMNRAQVILRVISGVREKEVLGLTATGQVREFVLRVRFKFRLYTPQGAELIPETELTLERNISYSESAALSKETEEGMLYRDMEKDLVQQIMRRLAAVKTLT